MENEAVLTSEESAARPDIFADMDFVGNITATELTLNDPKMTFQDRLDFIEIATETLNEHFGTDFLEEIVDVAGYAYIADEHGKLLLDEFGNAVQSCVDSKEAEFLGIDIIEVENPKEEKVEHKVVCKFANTIYTEDGSSHTDTYFIPPGDVLNFDFAEAFDESEALKNILDDFADDSEKALKHYSFTLACGYEQHRILRILVSQMREDILPIYEYNTVSVNAGEFYVVTLSEDGKPPEINFIDQFTLPPEEWAMPKGVIKDCQFIESITHSNTEKIRNPIHNCPCIVLEIENSNSLCFVPFRAFNFADIVDDTVEE